RRGIAQEPGSSAALKNRQEDAGDQEVHRGTGERDHDLLARLLGNPLQPGDAADRQERDIPGADPVMARGQGMSQLVEDDAPEERQEEADRLEGEGRALPPRQHEEDEDEKNEEGRVDPNRNPRDLRNLPGPTHEASSAAPDAMPRRA